MNHAAVLDLGHARSTDAHCLACGFELVGGADVGLCPKCGSDRWYRTRLPALVTVCAWCRAGELECVRRRNRGESFTITHGICPECKERRLCAEREGRETLSTGIPPAE